MEATISSMLVELDDRLVQTDHGVDYHLVAFWSPANGRTYIRWTRVGDEENVDDAGDFVEIDPGKLMDALRHPALYWPLPTQSL